MADAEAALKMKIRPVNAFFQCYNFAYLSGLPREELHQFLVGLYGEHIVPSAFYLITSGLRKPEFILSCSDKGVNKYLVSNEMLETVWIRLRDRLSSLDSSTSLLEVTSEYAAHFYDICWRAHRETSYWRSDSCLAPHPSLSVSRLDFSRGDVMFTCTGNAAL
jgi:hypothetical protein